MATRGLQDKQRATVFGASLADYSAPFLKGFNMGKLIDYDPYTKTKTVFEGNGDGSFAINQIQDCESILRFNKACQNTPELKANGIKSEYMHFARVPNTVLLEWRQKYGIDWNKKEDLPRIEKLLMSNEYKYLRTVDKI